MNIYLNLPNGIGDNLYVTPTIEVIGKHTKHKIYVHTKYPELFRKNPHVDKIDKDCAHNKVGAVKPVYQDPARVMRGEPYPDKHNILTMYEQVVCAYELRELKGKVPRIKPLLYNESYSGEKTNKIAVQVHTTGSHRKKKWWPGAEWLSKQPGFEPIQWASCLRVLINKLKQYKKAVVMEGGLSNLFTALNIPCVVIYGGFSSPEWNGYPQNINVVNKEDCGFCFNKQKCNMKCMENIVVDDIKKYAENL